ncbi:MAG: biotin/lipoyl-containing protein [candidate division WOR-3 bacterium]|nr:biotin/lipoyl-containing protein [candidate division WOR-3 bacterium]
MKKVFFTVIITFLSCKGDKKEIYSGVFTGEEYICRAQIGGKVISFPYSEGDRIKKGDTLIVIEDRKLRMDVVSKEYEVKNLRIHLKDAKEDF